ncbi:MAG: M18 family aminopeptidase [Oscillospiraceae bacterium]|jgi:aspartyl aminopeptidase|nr:M18 family aminopeptidase [Oscillospiraceae bacterium]
MRDLLTFLGESPSRFHAVENLRQTLEQEGYTRLSECGTWDLAVGGKYYVTRNGSALMAFRIPRKDFTGFMMSASHSDYPAFRVKENAELTGPEKYLRLNTERYGGQLLSTWLDRPLTVAGRVLVEEKGAIATKLVYVDKDLLMIPSVAAHMNREANNGFKFDPKCDMVPLMALDTEKGAFRKLVAEAAGCKAEDILGTDLFLCLRQKPLVWGANGEFVSAAGLDDLQCAYGCFKGFMEAKESSSVPVYVLFDNEEVGSQTKQGAGGTFLADLVDRVCAAMGRDKASAVACSFMVSADNAHAVHPNHPEFADATHRPAMNAGPVIKFGVRYATDGASQAIFTALCKKAGVPVQHFANRSDMAGGGTLGCISLGQLSVNTVDIGLPQLAMHSCFETAGSKDTEYLVKAMAEVYSASFREDHGLFTLA